MINEFQVLLLVCVSWSRRRASGGREADVSSLCSPQWRFKSFVSFVSISLRTINGRRRDRLYFSIFYILPDVCTLEREAVTSLWKPFYPSCCWQWGGQTSVAQIWWSHNSTETSVVSSGCQINRETALMRLYHFYWGNKITRMKTDSNDLCFKISHVCFLVFMMFMSHISVNSTWNLNLFPSAGTL